MDMCGVITSMDRIRTEIIIGATKVREMSKKVEERGTGMQGEEKNINYVGKKGDGDGRAGEEKEMQAEA